MNQNEKRHILNIDYYVNDLNNCFKLIDNKIIKCDYTNAIQIGYKLKTLLDLLDHISHFRND